MESKKINQLATELTPSLSDLTIIGDPSTGISKKITLSQMASLFTGTVEEYANVAEFPLVGVADTIYIALDTNVLYRWDTTLTSYVELSPNIINSLVFSDANGFDGNISLVGSVATLTITTALTTGSVPFIGASGALSQDNANLFFDDTNNRLGINTNAPTTALDAFGSGIIGRLNGTSTNNSFLGFASAGTNQWSIGNVQSDHRFRIYSEANTAELVSVLQTGEFGIGIANPTTKLHIDGGASALIANLDANVSVAKSISFRSDNSNRINLEVSGTESGSNAGANFFIRRYSDAGALIDTPLTITRSTGIISLATALSGTSGAFSGNLAVGGSTNDTSGGLYTNIAIDATTYSRYSLLTGGTARSRFQFDGTNTSLVATSTGGKLQIQTLGANAIEFATNDALRMTLTSAGNLGIGTATPDVTGFGYTTLTIKGGTTAGYAGVLELQTTQTTSNGQNIGIISFLDGTSRNAQIGVQRDSSTSTAQMMFYTNAGSGIVERMMITSGGTIRLNGSTQVRNGSSLLVYRSDNARALEFYTNNDACYIDAWEPSSEPLRIRSNGSGGRIEFHTATAERMRITNAGYLKASNDTAYLNVAGTYHEFTNNTSATAAVVIRNTAGNFTDNVLAVGSSKGSNSNFNQIAAYTSDFTNIVFKVRGDGNVYNVNGVYTSGVSDIKYKEQVVDANSQWEDIKNLRVVNFKFIKDVKENGEEALKHIGFIAQEVEKVSPNLIEEMTDNETSETWKTIKTSIIHTKAIKALQEAMLKIEALEEKVKQLELK